jgi:hypothetical protein
MDASPHDRTALIAVLVACLFVSCMIDPWGTAIEMTEHLAPDKR